MKALFDWIALQFKQAFCRHDYKTISEERYNVLKPNGTVEGEVTLTILQCTKCELDKIIPKDRTHHTQ